MSIHPRGLELKIKEFLRPRCETCGKLTDWSPPCKCSSHYCDSDCMEEDPLHTKSLACRQPMTADMWNGKWEGRSEGSQSMMDIWGVDSNGTFAGATDRQLPYSTDDCPMYILPGPLPLEVDPKTPIPKSLFAKADDPAAFDALCAGGNLMHTSGSYYAVRLPELPVAMLRMSTAQRSWFNSEVESCGQKTRMQAKLAALKKKRRGEITEEK